MIGCTVSHIMLKTVLRIQSRHFLHVGVSRGLGNDRGRRNFRYFIVTFDHSFGKPLPLRQFVAVNPDKIRLYRQIFNRLLHGTKRCLKDIDAVYDFRAHGTY